MANESMQKPDCEKKPKNTALIKKLAVGAGALLVVVAVVLIIILVVVPSSKYKKAVKLYENGDYAAAIEILEEIDSYKDSDSLLKDANIGYACSQADDACKEGDYLKAIDILTSDINILSDEKVKKQVVEVFGMISSRETVSANSAHTVAVNTDGTVVAVGSNDYGQCDVDDWTDIVAVSAGDNFTLGLKSNGDAVATGENTEGQCDIWENPVNGYVAVSAGTKHSVLLESDGTVSAYGDNTHNQCDVDDWEDIVAISAGGYHTVGLKSDGTVVSTNCNYDLCEASFIVDGSGCGDFGQNYVNSWEDITAISAGEHHTVGLKADGTVVAEGRNNRGQCNVYGWTDIVAVSAGFDYTVGIKSDGTVVVTGYIDPAEADVYYDGEWYNYFGTSSNTGKCEVGGWADVVAVSAGRGHTVGLKSDGTVIATRYTGVYYDGECEVSGWKDIKLPASAE